MEVEDECCKKFVLRARDSEGEVGANVRPAGRVHVGNKDEYKSAAAACKQEFNEDANQGSIPLLHARYACVEGGGRSRHHQGR